MKRDRFEIVLEILGICSEGASKTRIVYQANLNFKVAGTYLETLIREGLLCQDNQGKTKKYVTTEQGKRILEGCGKIYKTLENLFD